MPLAIQVWVYKCCLNVPRKVTSKVNNRISRLLNWKTNAPHLRLEYLMAAMFNGDGKKQSEEKDHDQTHFDDAGLKTSPQRFSLDVVKSSDKKFDGTVQKSEDKEPDHPHMDNGGVENHHNASVLTWFRVQIRILMGQRYRCSVPAVPVISEDLIYILILAHWESVRGLSQWLSSLSSKGFVRLDCQLKLCSRKVINTVYYFEYQIWGVTNLVSETKNLSLKRTRERGMGDEPTPHPDQPNPLGKHVSHTKFRTAFTTLANLVTTQNDRPAAVSANPVANFASVWIQDFTQINPSLFSSSKSEENPQEFLDQVWKVTDIMGVTSSKSAELAAYQLQDIAHTWFK
ncbi:hypothetical protein FXO38_32991 [Capsicum annuum]|nr:hypothetical protein FXO38_32991 [Capsicum annuum]